jgi:hypothetical protein
MIYICFYFGLLDIQNLTQYFLLININLDEMMKSANWTQIYIELIKHQDLMEIYMKTMDDKAKRLALYEMKFANLNVHE